MEEKHSTMSDYSLLDNLRDFPKLMPDEDSDKGRAKGDYSIRYGSGVISEELLESMIGQTFDLDDICYTETDSFQYGDKPIDVIEAVNEDRCFARKCNVVNIELVTKMNKIENHIHTRVNDACITDNGELYITDPDNNCIDTVSTQDQSLYLHHLQLVQILLHQQKYVNQ